MGERGPDGGAFGKRRRGEFFKDHLLTAAYGALKVSIPF